MNEKETAYIVSVSFFITCSLIDMAMEAIFGDSCANNSGGDIETLKRISEQELADCTEKAFLNGKYLLSVSGDICPEEAKSIAEKYKKEFWIDTERQELKRHSPVYRKEAQKAGFVVYAASGKLYVYHILRILELYINHQFMSGLQGRVILISMLSASLFAFYIQGEDSVQKMEKLQAVLRNKPLQEVMEKMTVLYLQTREYKMQSNPTRDALERALYQISYGSMKHMTEQALNMFTDIFSREPLYEVYVK